jgi:hypothetical protein
VQKKKPRARLYRLILALCVSLGAPNVAAVDFALTGFGTIGYAVSDKDFQYLRYIDNDGTFKADSLIGAQVEARFSPAWGATLQGVASAPRTRDNGYEATIRWAFVSYRPSNEWLFRAGRLRPPVLINTQNAEVGVTYDQLRLPVEVYSASPVYDVDGAAVTGTWPFGDGDLSLDAYWGKTHTKFRFPFQRFPADLQAFGAAARRPTGRYFDERITFKGLVASHTSPALLLRGGVHHAELKGEMPIEETHVPTLIPAPPPIGGVLFVPFNPKPKIDAYLITLGAEWRPGNWRVTAEYAQRIMNDTKLGVDSKSGYINIAHTTGKWTPYITHARLRSGSDTRSIYTQLNATPVPLAAQGLPLFLPATFHKILADQVFVFDQHSTMLGVSYAFSSTSKLKAEWMRTRVGLASVFVDGDVHNQSFNVFSISYSVAF